MILEWTDVDTGVKDLSELEMVPDSRELFLHKLVSMCDHYIYTIKKKGRESLTERDLQDINEAEFIREALYKC